MDVRFVIVSPTSRKAEHAVRLPVLLGRSDEAKFRVQQDSVSRRHCEFFIQDDLVHVRDLGSTNGTLVNGRRIKPSLATAVPPGTEIRVGGIVFRVDYASSASPRPTAAQGDDTVPMAAYHESPAEPPGELEPEGEAAEAAASAAEAPNFGALTDDADAANEATGLNFLGGGTAEPEGGGDDKLDDFFKSLK